MDLMIRLTAYKDGRQASALRVKPKHRPLVVGCGKGHKPLHLNYFK